MERRSNAITEGVIWKQLLLFFFPILLGTFFQQLYNTADAAIVGNGVGKEALAAVGGTTANLINLLVGFFVGLSSGATVIISQFYGARDDDGVRKALHTSAAMALLFGAILTALGLLTSGWLLRLMGTPSDVLPHAEAYIRIIYLGMIPSLIYNIGSGVLRALGDSKRPLYFLIVACLTNIALDALFVLALGMGTAGAAFATVLSQCISALLIIRALLRRTNASRLSPREVRFDLPQLRRIISIGLPAGLQSVMYSLSNVIIQRAVNGFDTDILAGWTAYGKLDGLYWMTVSAFGIAVTTFVGQNYGAGRMDRVKKSVRDCTAMTVGATVVLSSVLYFFGGTFYRLFTSDPDVIEAGVHILRLLVPFYICYIPIELLSGALRGMGNTLVPTLMTLIGICLFRVIWVLLVAPAYHSIDMVLYSYPITWILTGALFIFYYRSHRWA
ncbi:MAG: MATE family efflux transporter [Clostridia bacterium]|nr:MATE family efflux transporter [Clostridia bacterium]